MRDENEKSKIQEDPFYNLENKANDNKIAKKERPRIHSIMERQNERFENDFDNNLLLRKMCKADKKEAEQKEKEENKPKNFALPLAPTRQTDMKRAEFVHFKGPDNYQKNRMEKRSAIMRENIF